MHSPELIEITIDDLAFGGDGVGRVEGKACFVPGTIPGETCRVRLVTDKKSFLRAELVEVLEASPDRVDPLCPVFGQCGGCQYQHMDYAAELKYKEQQVKETFSRLGGLEDPPVGAIIPSPSPYGYRNRIQVHVENSQPGFKGRDGRTHVPVESCPIADEDINQQLSGWVKTKRPKRGRITLVSGDTAPDGFSQINRRLQKELRKQVESAVSGFGARRLIEFYAGSGFFTRAWTESHEKVTPVEWDRRLVERGRKALPAAEWLEMDVDQSLHHLPAAEVGSDTIILVDPPREGLSGPLKDWLKTVGACGLVYLSCNPATQARDLKELSGSWHVESIQPIDLFPQTAHIESLVVCRPERDHPGRTLGHPA